MPYFFPELPKNPRSLEFTIFSILLRLRNVKGRSVNCAPTMPHKGKPERRDDFSEKIPQLREAAQKDRNLDDKHSDLHSYFKQTWDYFN